MYQILNDGKPRIAYTLSDSPLSTEDVVNLVNRVTHYEISSIQTTSLEKVMGDIEPAVFVELFFN